MTHSRGPTLSVSGREVAAPVSPIFQGTARRCRRGRAQTLPSQQNRLRYLPAQAALHSQRAQPKDPEIHPWGRARLAREIAKTDAYAASMRARKKIEMLFVHLKRILKLDRLRLRGPKGAQDEFLIAATAQNLRKLAKLVPKPA